MSSQLSSSRLWGGPAGQVGLMEDAVGDDHCKVRCFESKTLRFFFFPMLMSDEWNEEFWEFGPKKNQFEHVISNPGK